MATPEPDAEVDARDKLLKEIEEMDVYPNMSWPSDVQFLQFYEAAAAPFGGPIALIPKHPRPSSIDPFLRVFNACGVEITRYNWYDDHVKALGWSNEEELFCVLRDGRVMQYDACGQSRVFYSVFEEDEQEDAVDAAKVWPRGIAIITCLFQIVVFHDLTQASTNPHPVTFQPHPNPSGNQYASALSLIEGYCNRSGQAELLYSLWDSRAHVSSIVVSTPSNSMEIPLAELYPPCPGDVNCIVDLSVHDDGKYVAICTVSGSVTVFSADFKQTFVHVEMKAMTPPVSCCWFGRQFESHATLAVAWAQPPVLMLCDMAAGVRWIPVSSNFLMVPEIDGLRVINKASCVFYQRAALTDAGKYLLKIYESSVKAKFAGGSKSDQRLAVLAMLHDTGKLQQGVDELMKAAAARFTSADQKLFLDAAMFGKAFANRYRSFDPLKFKKHAAEVSKQMQQKGAQSAFTQGSNDPTLAFVQMMREKAFGINKSVSVACKRMRLRNSLLLQPTQLNNGSSSSSSSSNGKKKDKNNNKSNDNRKNNGRIRRYGQDLLEGKSGGRSNNSGSKQSAKTLPCIPLTGKQHDALGEAAIIRRLVRRQNFEFAAQVCTFLSWSKETVLLEWAKAKIRSLQPPPDRYQGTTEYTERDETIDAMLTHLENQGFRCYAHLALAAHNCRDDQMAERMIRLENSLNQQLGASLLMGKCEDALRQAVASRDEQLCLALLVHLKRHQYPNDDVGYMRLLDRVPYAHSYLLSLRRQQSSDGQKLFQLVLRDSASSGWQSGQSSPKTPGSPHKDNHNNNSSSSSSNSNSNNNSSGDRRHLDAGNLMLGLAAQAQNPREKLAFLEQARAAFTHPDAPSDLQASAQLVREAIELTEVQISKLPPNMGQLSLYDTIRECSARSDGGEELAGTMKDLFRIDNGVYYRLKVQGMAQDHRWGDLEALSKKGQVVKVLGTDGLRAFVKECVAANAPMEVAASYLDRMRDRKQRMLAAADVKDYELAAAIAMDLGDDNMVNVVMAKAGIRTNYQKQDFINAAQNRDPRGKSIYAR